MADWEGTDNALLAKIDELLEALDAKGSANNEATSRKAANLALAAHHLAEARAWLIRPDQPHGGTSNSSGS